MACQPQKKTHHQLGMSNTNVICSHFIPQWLEGYPLNFKIYKTLGTWILPVGRYDKIERKYIYIYPLCLMYTSPNHQMEKTTSQNLVLIHQFHSIGSSSPRGKAWNFGKKCHGNHHFNGQGSVSKSPRRKSSCRTWPRNGQLASQKRVAGSASGEPWKWTEDWRLILQKEYAG